MERNREHRISVCSVPLFLIVLCASLSCSSKQVVDVQEPAPIRAVLLDGDLVTAPSPTRALAMTPDTTRRASPPETPAVAMCTTPQSTPDVPQYPKAVMKTFGMGEASAGVVVKGLEFRVAQTGPTPQPDERITLWILLTNTTQQPIDLHAYWWNLKIQESPTSTTRLILSGLSPREPLDFLRIAPGETLRMLMDAQVPMELPTGTYRVELDITAPSIAGSHGITPFDAGGQLVSNPVPISVAAPQPKPDNWEHVEAFVGAEEPAASVQAADALLNAPNRMELLRRGLRLRDHDQSWAIFALVTQNPLPDLAPDLVEYLARMGPRNTRRMSVPVPPSGSTGTPAMRDVDLDDALTSFTQGLAPGARGMFYRDVCAAIHYDHRHLYNMMRPLMANGIPEELDAAAAVFTMQAERSSAPADSLAFLAQRIGFHPDPAKRDPKAGLKYAKLALLADPGNISRQFVVARLEGDREKEDRIIDAITDPFAMNSIAWGLVGEATPTKEEARLAVRLATRAVEEAGESDVGYHIWDTLAAAYAGAGDYENAWRAQENALARCPRKESLRPGFAERVTTYLVAKHAGDKETMQATLLERYRTSTDGHLRKALAAALRRQFPDVEGLEDILTAPPTRNTPDPVPLPEAEDDSL